MGATHADEGSDQVRAALAALRVERRRVVDEREAFRAFRGRVSSIPDESGSAGTARSELDGRRGVGGAVGSAVRDAVGNAPRPGSRLVAVRDAYRATVMSVPHYEAEYDDTYERSVAEEFGPELAYALTRTNCFRGEYKRSLLSAAESAVAERKRLLDAVESEIESVERADSRLGPIRSEIGAIEDEIGVAGSEGVDGADVDDLGFGALDACRTRAEALRDDCDRIAARRQRVLADHRRRLALGDDVDLPTYCYQGLDVSYPVLAAVGVLGDRLTLLRSRIERAMARG